jgi:hypothetical protein
VILIGVSEALQTAFTHPLNRTNLARNSVVSGVPVEGNCPNDSHTFAGARAVRNGWRRRFEFRCRDIFQWLCQIPNVRILL